MNVIGKRLAIIARQARVRGRCFIGSLSRYTEGLSLSRKGIKNT